MSQERQFSEWFKQATGYVPYPFQVRFACERILPSLVDVPTGLGKTAMAVLGWVWGRLSSGVHGLIWGSKCKLMGSWGKR